MPVTACVRGGLDNGSVDNGSISGFGEWAAVPGATHTRMWLTTRVAPSG
ncbi:hypothetical protein [Cryobacterium algoricola]|nr:hypothetical protein [Cryobacterium algoricola]